MNTRAAIPCNAHLKLIPKQMWPFKRKPTRPTVADWSSPRQLVELTAFYERARAVPDSISDEEFIENITKAFWPTNCWSFVEASFAIIAPGCALRPHLTRELIRHPIDAMIAGGQEDPQEVIKLGMVCATKKDHYVEPTEEGKKWLLEDWPRQKDLAIEVFNERWQHLTGEAAN